MSETVDAEPAANVRVSDATIRRLRAAQREYGEQCPAAIRLREILPADSRELRRSLRRLAAEQRLDAARTGRVAGTVESNISEDELTPVQRAELDQARSRATASMVLGIMAWREGGTTSTIDDALRNGPGIARAIAA